MSIVVSDTGPLLHLAEADLLHLLAREPTVHVPPAVAVELQRLDDHWLKERPSWMQVTQLDADHQKEARSWTLGTILDVGEAHALALARQVRADQFLTDDNAARALAVTLGVEVHGSLGVVLDAAEDGYLDRREAMAALDRLAATSLWLSLRVLAAARRAVEELFEQP